MKFNIIIKAFILSVISILQFGCVAVRSVKVADNSCCFIATADQPDYLLADFFCKNGGRPHILLKQVNFAQHESGEKFSVKTIEHDYDLEKGYMPPRHRLYLVRANESGRHFEWVSGGWTMEIVIDDNGVMRVELVRFSITTTHYSPLTQGAPN